MKGFKEKLKSEVQGFREYGHKFLNKEVTKGEFKGVSGGMGVYAQKEKDKFMIRLRTSSGLISHKHLNLILSYAEKYNLKGIHLTTRQAVQLHDLGFDSICDIMEDAINNELYTRGSGGNFPRNVALSPLSGVEKGEAFDVTPFALQVGDYLMNQITSYKLPRKLKISFSSSDKDEACASVNDLGFLAVVENGEPLFKLYIAGGLGSNPATAIEYDKLIEPSDVLYHVEAITNLFIAEGDYENKGKARIRYIPRRMGVEEFIKCYEGHLDNARKKLNINGIEASITKDNNDNNIEDTNCLISQKQSDLYTAVIHPISGQLSREDLKTIVEFVNENPNADIRLSMNESMYIRNLSLSEAKRLLSITENMRQVSNLEQSVSCIGVPTCQMGIEKSQELLKAILNKVKEEKINDEYLPSLHISGCMNSCSRHQISEIGLAGSKKKVSDVFEEVFEVHVGGFNSKNETKLGNILGFMLTREIPKFICELGTTLNKAKKPFKDYLKENEEEFMLIANKYIVCK